MNTTKEDLKALKELVEEYNNKEYKNNYHALKIIKSYTRTFIELSSIALNKNNDQELFMDCHSLGHTLELMLEGLTEDKDYYPPEMDMSGFDKCMEKCYDIAST